MLIAIDLETTGLHTLFDEIIEIGCIAFDPQTGEEIKRFSSLVRPSKPIPQAVQDITGISDMMVTWAPSWEDIRAEVIQFLDDTPLVAHNANFDVGFLRAKWVALNNTMIFDTFFLANILHAQFDNLKLSSLTTYYNIDHF